MDIDLSDSCINNYNFIVSNFNKGYCVLLNGDEVKSIDYNFWTGDKIEPVAITIDDKIIPIFNYRGLISVCTVETKEDHQKLFHDFKEELKQNEN